ncbi:hypothetical protein NDU88_003188 [Pleurodeles waltl]|uniref:Uncharacterized protein n=1 Tax=Pleurodeles waltl TaxID=8319 RepID=A0AAV7UFF1_PLEWA|nr:hypothetical protein NDU88_003188 [Pleurodeles waltl]
MPETEQKAFKLEKKRRRPKAEIVHTEEKKEFDDFLKEFCIPTDSTATEDEDHQLAIPEPHEEEHEEFFKIEEAEYEQEFDDSSHLEEICQDLNAESPEERVDNYPLRPSPRLCTTALLKELQNPMGFSWKKRRREHVSLPETLVPAQKGNLYLPRLPRILDQGKEPFREPATIRVVTPRVK